MKTVNIKFIFLFLSIVCISIGCSHEPFNQKIHSDDPLSYISEISGEYNMVGTQYDGLDTTPISFKDNLQLSDSNSILRYSPTERYVLYTTSKTDKTITFVYTYNAPLNISARDTIIYYYLSDSITHSGYETYSSGSRKFTAHSVK